MKIQFLNGGLANQVFQYIFVRYAELKHPEENPWLIDDSFFFVNQVHNGYELEKVFGIKANLLSRNFTADVWDELINNKRKGISIPQSLKNLGFDIVMVSGSKNYMLHNPFDGIVIPVACNAFIPEVTDIQEDIVYYHGYWIQPGWLNAYREILLKELTFPPITDEVNRRRADEIISSESVAVHVRRGDYVTLGWQSEDHFFKDGICQVLDRSPDASFFVFSDDIPWCRRNSEQLGLTLTSRVTYVEGNEGNNAYIDLQLMTLCKGMVLCKSAFSYLAALMSDRLEYFVQDGGRPPI